MTALIKSMVLIVTVATIVAGRPMHTTGEHCPFGAGPSGAAAIASGRALSEVVC
jgi:hypothetical protein